MFKSTFFFVIILAITFCYPLTSTAQETAAGSTQKNNRSQQTQTNDKKSFDSASADLSEEQCEKITDGNAMIERIARLEGAMSVKNLTLKYFDKALFNFSDADFEYMKLLKPFCDNSSEDVAKLIFDKLKDKIHEAKETRKNTIEWIKKTTDQLQGIGGSPSSVKKIHNAWKEMENRSHEMLEGDLKYLADFLNRIREKVYEKSGAGNVKFISPFTPPDTMPEPRKND
ncbi:MAG: hypothetical protein CMM58_11970 [Rhodospirillaceae bacterium]|nr:hypothetical protein [Rhodospirillaceae bacterium]